jgi:hypothetical protein
MRLQSAASIQVGARLPIVEPVSALPGLPAVPGEVRRPVPSIGGRIHRQPESR